MRMFSGKTLRGGLCLLLALLLLVSALPAAADGEKEAQPDENVRVAADAYGVPRLVSGTYTDKKVTSFSDAMEAARRGSRAEGS